MKKDYPKISIITPNFNQAQYLEYTIKSVLDQKYPNLEYIIIDGGSTDGSIDIIKKYEDELAYWVSEPDDGLYDALNKGFQKSTGEIMGWINSDDMFFSGAFHTITEIFISYPQIKWLTGKPAIYDKEGRPVHVYQQKKWSKYEFYLMQYQWIQQESTFWVRDLWIQSGEYIDKNLKLAGDLELWLRFFRHEKLYVSHSLIGGFRFRGAEQLSSQNYESYIDEANRAILGEPLSKNDKRIIRRYKLVKKLIKVLSCFKVFNTPALEQKLKRELFDFPKEIFYDRNTQKFVLK